MSTVTTMGDAFNILQDSVEGVTGERSITGNVKSVSKNLVHDVSSSISSSARKMVKSVKNTDDVYDDNVYVPVNQKTLLGYDFNTLYDSFDTVPYGTDNGRLSDIMIPRTGYDTEIHGWFGRADSPSSYDCLSDEDKLVFEMTAVSKKYADAIFNAYFEENGSDKENDDQSVSDGNIKQDENKDVSDKDGDTSSKQDVESRKKTCKELGEEYAQIMSQYKAYCDTLPDFSWNEALYYTSGEFQLETSQYIKDNAGEVFGNTSSDRYNKYVANGAHNLLLAVSGDEYQDSLFSLVDSNSVSYDDTIRIDIEDLEKCKNSPHATSFASVFSKIVDFIAEKWKSVQEHFSTAKDCIVKEAKDIDNGIKSYAESEGIECC